MAPLAHAHMSRDESESVRLSALLSAISSNDLMKAVNNAIDGRFTLVSAEDALHELKLRSHRGAPFIRVAVSRHLLDYLATPHRRSYFIDTAVEFISYSALNSASGFRNELADFILHSSSLRYRLALVQRLQQDAVFSLETGGALNDDKVNWLTHLVSRFIVKESPILTRLDSQPTIFEDQEKIIALAKEQGFTPCQFHLR
jgi:hypothetical protein